MTQYPRIAEVRLSSLHGMQVCTTNTNLEDLHQSLAGTGLGNFSLPKRQLAGLHARELLHGYNN
jgi:hypothetical protein